MILKHWLYWGSPFYLPFAPKARYYCQISWTLDEEPFGFDRPQKPPESFINDWQVEYWEKTLAHISEVTESIQSVQKSWMHLGCVIDEKKTPSSTPLKQILPSKWLVLRVFPDVANSEKGSSLKNHVEACWKYILKVYVSRIKLRMLYHCNPRGKINPPRMNTVSKVLGERFPWFRRYSPPPTRWINHVRWRERRLHQHDEARVVVGFNGNSKGIVSAIASND